MVLTWNPASVPALLAMVTGTVLALVVLFARPDRSQNRRLALLLAVEGLQFGAGLGLAFMADEVSAVRGFFGVMIVGMLALPWAYLAFLGTLNTPLVRPFSGRTGTGVVVIGALVSVGSWFAFPGFFIQGIVPVDDFMRWDWVWMPLGRMVFLPLFLVALFGLAVAFSVYHRTPPDAASRPTSAAYLLAFGVRDGLGVIALSWILFGPQAAFTVGVFFSVWLPCLASVAFALLLAYGVLRTQMFGIDLKLKWTLSKSTVAAVFVAVFFLVSELAETLFSEVAGPFLGVGAAAVLVFALAPLQRFADRLANAAMPEVQDTQAYRDRRAREIYHAAVEAALEDGRITDRERDVLARLVDELGLSSRDALAVEREAAQALGQATR